MPETLDDKTEIKHDSRKCSLNDKIALPSAGMILVGVFSFIGASNYYDEINYPVLIATGIGVAVGAVSGYIAHRLIQKYVVERRVVRKT